MKYRRLTKEQFESLSDEFINYLSVQGITSNMWTEYKETRLDQVDEHLDQFSDLIWKGVLSSLKYLEQISAQHIHLFKLQADGMHLIAIKVFNPRIDLSSTNIRNIVSKKSDPKDLISLEVMKYINNNKLYQ